MLNDIPDFSKICMQFYFKLQDNPESFDPVDSIYFARIDQIFKLNFETEKINTECMFDEPFIRQPTFFLMDDDQVAAIAASQTDGLYVSIKTKK